MLTNPTTNAAALPEAESERLFRPCKESPAATASATATRNHTVRLEFDIMIDKGDIACAISYKISQSDLFSKLDALEFGIWNYSFGTPIYPFIKIKHVK
jgi:hypothetical protein